VIIINQNTEFNLEFSKKALAMIEELGQKTGRNDEQVVEQVLQEYLMKQLHLVEKRAAETGVDINEALNLQFERLLEFLLSKHSQ